MLAHLDKFGFDTNYSSACFGGLRTKRTCGRCRSRASCTCVDPAAAEIDREHACAAQRAVADMRSEVLDQERKNRSCSEESVPRMLLRSAQEHACIRMCMYRSGRDIGESGLVLGRCRYSLVSARGDRCGDVRMQCGLGLDLLAGGGVREQKKSRGRDHRAHRNLHWRAEGIEKAAYLGGRASPPVAGRSGGPRARHRHGTQRRTRASLFVSTGASAAWDSRRRWDARPPAGQRICGEQHRRVTLHWCSQAGPASGHATAADGFSREQRGMGRSRASRQGR